MMNTVALREKNNQAEEFLTFPGTNNFLQYKVKVSL